jgi:hypothetical protein
MVLDSSDSFIVAGLNIFCKLVMMSWRVNILFVSFSVRSFVLLYSLFIPTTLGAFQYNENHVFSNSLVSFSFLVMVSERI